mgnify:CR=1 FL=1
MKLKEMIELVQQHHPHMGETEIVKLLNRAKDDFCEQTEIVKTTRVMSTVANQRYYELHQTTLRIKDVWLDSVRIPRLIGKPIIDDTDSGEY